MHFTNRIGEFVVDEIEKVRLEVEIDDDSKEDEVIDAIVDAAWTGHPGDGRVFVLPVTRSIKIRTAH